MVKGTTMQTLDDLDLGRIHGGAQTAWDKYVAGQRTAVAPAYKSVVCTAAGVKGGPEFATQVYGAARTTTGDKIRAAETIRGVCMGGARLPEAAPQSPF
jgi:hypothetical protein